MYIDITNEPNATRITIVNETINWVTFGTDTKTRNALRVNLTTAQLDSIVACYQEAKEREELLAELHKSLLNN